MNEPTIRRLLGLAEKTGDKVIVTDPAGEHPYVLMTLDQYERMVGVQEKAPAPAQKPLEPRALAKPQAPPWRAKLGLDVVEPPVRDLLKSQSPAKMMASRHETVGRPMPPISAPADAGFDMEGEERFYLEPIE